MTPLLEVVGAAKRKLWGPHMTEEKGEEKGWMKDDNSYQEKHS